MPYEASHILPMLSSCAETTSTISISSTVTSLAHWASNCFFARTRKRCHEDWQFVQNPDSVAAPPAAQPVAFALGRFPMRSAHLANNSFNVSRIVVVHNHTQDLRRSRAHGVVSFLCCKKKETDETQANRPSDDRIFRCLDTPRCASAQWGWPHRRTAERASKQSIRLPNLDIRCLNFATCTQHHHNRQLLLESSTLLQTKQ